MKKIDLETEFKNLENQIFSKVSTYNLTIEEIIEESKVKYSEKSEAPPVCLEIESPNSNSIIATIGTFSVIIGKSKSRKTYRISLLV